MRQPPAQIHVFDRTDRAVATKLGQEIDAFNMAAVGIYDGRELFASVCDERGGLVAGVDGWTWGGTGWIEHLWGRGTDRGHGIGGRRAGAAGGGGGGRGGCQIALDTPSFRG